VQAIEAKTQSCRGGYIVRNDILKRSPASCRVAAATVDEIAQGLRLCRLRQGQLQELCGLKTQPFQKLNEKGSPAAISNRMAPTDTTTSFRGWRPRRKQNAHGLTPSIENILVKPL
jgi:hypothetical protein